MIEANSTKKAKGSGKKRTKRKKSNNAKRHDFDIRPSNIDEIVGRKSVKKKVMMMITAAKKRDETVDHMLFYGPPGLGKTTFAMAIAGEVNSFLHVTSGPAIRKQGDLATLMTSLSERDVLFIDEIHRLARGVEEILYPAMEDGKIDVVVGKGVSAKTLRLNLKPFTLIGATTRIDMVSSPMRDRFGLVQRLKYFKTDELQEILIRASKILKVQCHPDALNEIAKRSRGTARVALRILRRIRDYQDSYVEKDGVLSLNKQSGSIGIGDEIDDSSEVSYGAGGIGVSKISLETTLKALKLLGIDEMGLEMLDRKILHVLMKDYDGGPVGLTTLAASVSEEATTIADVYEPFLMNKGLLKRTSSGRMLTAKGRKYVKDNY